MFEETETDAGILGTEYSRIYKYRFRSTGI